MLSGISTIYFSTELAYPPLPQFAVKKEHVRELYNKLNTPGGYPYDNLDLQSDVPTLSTRHERGKSCCEVGSGRVRILEEAPAHRGITADDFIGIAKTVLSHLDIGPFISQRCVIRCTAQPNNIKDSLDLLAGSVARVLEPIDPFGRPPSFFGVRFRFAPHEDGTESDEGAVPAKPTDQVGTAAKEGEGTKAKRPKRKKKTSVMHRGWINLRFETYSQDIKQVWMEADAQYVEDIIEVGNLTLVEKNIRETYNFLTENAKAFLDQFDVEPSDEK